MRKVSPAIRRNHDAKLNIGQESFRDSLLFRWQLSDGARQGRRMKGSRIGFHRRASHRKFSLREPAENSIGMVWILVSRDERSARFWNTDASRQVLGERKSLVFFIPSLSLSMALARVKAAHLTSPIWEVNGKGSQAASYLVLPLTFFLEIKQMESNLSSIMIAANGRENNSRHSWIATFMLALVTHLQNSLSLSLSLSPSLPPSSPPLSLSLISKRNFLVIFYPLFVCKIYENRPRYRRHRGFGSRPCNSNIKLSPAFALSESDDTSAIGGRGGTEVFKPQYCRRREKKGVAHLPQFRARIYETTRRCSWEGEGVGREEALRFGPFAGPPPISNNLYDCRRLHFYREIPFADVE